MAKDNVIYKFHPENDKGWKPIIIESDFVLPNISRLAVNPDGKKIAIVVDE